MSAYGGNYINNEDSLLLYLNSYNANSFGEATAENLFPNNSFVNSGSGFASTTGYVSYIDANIEGTGSHSGLGMISYWNKHPDDPVSSHHRITTAHVGGFESEASYSLSYWGKKASETGSQHYRSWAYGYFYDGADNIIGTNLLIVNPTFNSTEWKRYGNIFTTPSGTQRMHFLFYAGDTQNVHYYLGSPSVYRIDYEDRIPQYVSESVIGSSDWKDLSGNGNDFSLVSSSYNFQSGKIDYQGINNRSLLKSDGSWISLTNDFTISFWMYLYGDPPSGGYHSIIHNLNGGPNRNRILLTDDNFIWHQYTSLDTNYSWAVLTPAFGNGAWYNITFQKSSDFGFKLYSNTTFISGSETDLAKEDLNSGTNATYLNRLATYFCYGEVPIYLIWDRILNEYEIQTIYYQNKDTFNL